MKTIPSPGALSGIENHFSVFFAGSIESRNNETWRERTAQALEQVESLCILDPRRHDWDANWKEEIGDPQFHEQVSWELDAMEKADLIVFYFSPDTKSPISMLEFGLFARSAKALVCCPEGFQRKGNVDIVCARYGVEQVNTLEEMIQAIKDKVAG